MRTEIIREKFAVRAQQQFVDSRRLELNNQNVFCKLGNNKFRMIKKKLED